MEVVGSDQHAEKAKSHIFLECYSNDVTMSLVTLTCYCREAKIADVRKTENN